MSSEDPIDQAQTSRSLRMMKSAEVMQGSISLSFWALCILEQFAQS